MRKTMVIFVISLAVLVQAAFVFGREKGRAYFDLGVFAYEEGDYEGAEKDFSKALDLGPGNPLYLQYLGRTYLKMEKYDQAEKYLVPARQSDPELTGLTYDLAYLHFKKEEYLRASQLFEEVAAEEKDNVLALYYAGISLYRMQEYNRALDFLMRAAELSPSIKVNGYYFAAICLAKTGAFRKAVPLFAYVRDNAESAELKDNAIKWLEAVNAGIRAAKPYRLYVKIGYRYDDNVLLEPLNEDLFTNEADELLVVFASGWYEFFRKEDQAIGVGYSHYQTWHETLEAYDLTGSLFEIYGRKTKGPVTFRLAYSPNYFWLDDDSYLMRHQIRPEVTYNITSDFTAGLVYGYSTNKYFQFPEKSGHTNEVLLRGQYTVRSPKALVFGAVGYEGLTASEPDEFYDLWQVSAGLILPLPLNWTLGISGRYYRKDYENRDSNFLVKREDDKYNATLFLSHKLFYDWLDITGEYNYTKNNSNIDAFSYRRNVATLSLNASF